MAKQFPERFQVSPWKGKDKIMTLGEKEYQWQYNYQPDKLEQGNLH